MIYNKIQGLNWMQISPIPPQPVNITHTKSIGAQEVEWMLYSNSTFCMITLIQGNLDDGKSMFAMTLVALLTRGHPLTFVDTSFQSTIVIFQNTEDDADDTVIP